MLQACKYLDVIITWPVWCYDLFIQGLQHNTQSTLLLLLVLGTAGFVLLLLLGAGRQHTERVQPYWCVQLYWYHLNEGPGNVRPSYRCVLCLLFNLADKRYITLLVELRCFSLSFINTVFLVWFLSFTIVRMVCLESRCLNQWKASWWNNCKVMLFNLTAVNTISDQRMIL